MHFIMRTLMNDMEWFRPLQLPLSLKSISVQDFIHESRMNKLTNTREYVCNMGNTADRFSSDFPLAAMVFKYTKDIRDVSHASALHYENAVAEIKHRAHVRKAEIDAAHSSHLTPAYRHAVKACKDDRDYLIRQCETFRDWRNHEIAEAKERMHRQLTAHAFLTCDLSWKLDFFMPSGVYLGFFKKLDIESWRLQKHVDDSPDGVYRLRLEWMPARGATEYPAHLHVDRIDDGQFAIQNIEWRPYDESMADDGTGTDDDPSTVDIYTTIRCRFVAAEQDAERTAKERAELDEKNYKKTLPIWKLLRYKTGDYLKTRAARNKLRRTIF